jgi:cytoplasmic iron level regulating protein YaaA (DUF328/UPF0246 family)
MLALLSPAKSLDYERPLPGFEPSRPRFAEEADGLAAAASKLSAKKLSGLMGISDKLGKLNAERYKAFADAPERPALFAFNGDVYLGFEARSLDEPAIAFAQDHVRILSGLYGLLRPLDAIRPYRLEMGTKWAPGRAKDLYGWWGRRISDALAGDLAGGAAPAGRRAHHQHRFPREWAQGALLQQLRRETGAGHDGALDLRAPDRRAGGAEGV